jgi:lipopolysaccharide transport system ATP-binding protein
VSQLSEEILDVYRVWRRYRRYQRPPTSIKEAFIRTFKRDLVYEDFWALQDVTFSVRRGETLGFCGSNGSGKSTLLRVVANTLPLTHGRINVKAKMATLMDLGAGFLPELTGRENIKLNGAIMGLSDSEVGSKLDSIVDFAGLGDFIDSPVKIYSSGMYLRLGFAIAVHVQADILLIDEILAVGDAEFQQKCVDRLHQMQKAGTALLLVSHDLHLLESLCDRVIWLNKGRVMAEGPPSSVLQQYHPSLVSVSV